jgi:hypothetical protein
VLAGFLCAQLKSVFQMKSSATEAVGSGLRVLEESLLLLRRNVPIQTAAGYIDVRDVKKCSRKMHTHDATVLTFLTSFAFNRILTLWDLRLQQR